MRYARIAASLFKKRQTSRAREKNNYFFRKKTSSIFRKNSIIRQHWVEATGTVPCTVGPLVVPLPDTRFIAYAAGQPKVFSNKIINNTNRVRFFCLLSLQ